MQFIIHITCTIKMQIYIVMSSTVTIVMGCFLYQKPVFSVSPCLRGEKLHEWHILCFSNISTGNDARGIFPSGVFLF